MTRTAARHAGPPDEMVPDPQVCREFGITGMTLYRWTKDPKMGFPPPIKFSNKPTGRNYRSRRQLEAFKARMMQRAIAARAEEQV
jgi:predicted DNA-binding transcriptional regulator AlpA